MAGRDFARHQRVAAELLRVLGTLLRSEVRDPRLNGISLAEVEVAKDLGVAKVFFIAADDADVPEAKIALARASGFLRSKAGQMLKMRFVPALRFEHDDSMAQGERVEALLSRLRAKDF